MALRAIFISWPGKKEKFFLIKRILSKKQGSFPANKQVTKMVLEKFKISV